MSCMVLNPRHFRTLVTWASARGVTYRLGRSSSRSVAGNEDACMSVLWRENVRAFEHRYRDRGDTNTQPEFRFIDVAASLQPVAIIKAVDALLYQLAEPPDWQETEAYALCQAIRDAAIAQLPGYRAAPWELQ